MGQILLPEGASPATPLTGNVAIYAKTDGAIYSKDDTGAEKALSGSGSITASGYTQSTARILGRTTASSGAVEELTVSEGIQMGSGTVKADVNGLTEDTTPDTSADFALVYDASAAAHKKVKLNKIGASFTSGTAITTTSGTAHDFTGLPSSVKKITVTIQGVSTNGTSPVGVQIGASGGIENTGYAGSVYDFASWASLSSGFFDATSGSTVIREGTFELTLVDSSTNTWACTYMIVFSHSAGGRIGAGTKSLSATLDRVRLTTSGGSNTFDAGKVNIVYQ